LYISESEVDQLLSQKQETQKPSTNEVGLLSAEIDRKKKSALQKGVELRLESLRNLLNLTELEMDTVLVALASEIDPKYSKLFAYLQEDVTKKKPTIGLVLTLFCTSRENAIKAQGLFTRNSRLQQNSILTINDTEAAFIEKPLKLDERVVSFLLGSDELDATVATFASVIQPTNRVKHVDASETDAGVFKAFTELKPVFLLHGSNEPQEFAKTICNTKKTALIVANAEKLKTDNLQYHLRLLLRETLFQRAALYFDKFDSASEETRKTIVETAEHCSEVVFIPTKAGLSLKKKTISVTLPNLRSADREKVWKIFLGDFPGIDGLVAKFRFNANEIASAVETAQNLALLKNPSHPKLTLDDLYAGCRSQSSPIQLAVKINPRYSWQDIVIPLDKKQQLLEIRSYVKHLGKVYESWGFDKHYRSKGLNILFSGQSGTGKTMAAEIIAHDLNLDMYKIDLSLVVSKYIGETEKNLNRIFEEAEKSNAVLFFDEADALFGKRSEVKDSHDRYANIEIGYLLQKMEEQEGIVILATNLSKNIDDAFTRRMNFIVEFPFPNEESRLAMWHQIFPDKTPIDTIDYQFLAKLQISGGNIRNIAAAAAFLAAEDSARVDMKHIVRAAKREFQKISKDYSKEDFGKYYELLE